MFAICKDSCSIELLWIGFCHPEQFSGELSMFLCVSEDPSFFKKNYRVIVYGMNVVSFVYSPVEVHVDCVLVLVSPSEAAMGTNLNI